MGSAQKITKNMQLLIYSANYIINNQLCPPDSKFRAISRNFCKSQIIIFLKFVHHKSGAEWRENQKRQT